MSEEIQQTTEEPTNLPSDAEAKAESFDWNSVAEKNEYLKQFKSLDDMTEKYKSLHNQYATTVQKQKEAERQQQQSLSEQQQQQEFAQKQQETIQKLLPTYLENNMELTPEIEKELTEVGLDIRDVKLGAIELKERIQNAHNVVGGKEEYENMLSWAKENLSDKQKKAFDKDVTGELSEFAIKGLYSQYKEVAQNPQQPQDRLRGSSANVGVQPYQSRADLLRDRSFINSGRASQSDIAKHKARVNATPDNVIFG